VNSAAAKKKILEVERLAEIERQKRQKDAEQKSIEEEANKRIEDLVAKRVEEELERRRDEIEAEVLRRVEEAKKIMEAQMLEELERRKQEQLEEAQRREDVYGIRSTPPVIYTGKRGRPPKVRPNQVDPHEKERQEIAQKFSDSSPKIVIQTEKTSNSTEQPGKSTTEDTYTTFDQVTESDETTTNTSNMNSGQLDPSSEAEALSHVASGIAASLGVLAAESPSNVADSEANNGPLSGLTDLTTENYEVSGNNQVFESRGVKRGRNDMETSSEENSPAKKVTKLAMEWTEDEEEENNLSSQTT